MEHRWSKKELLNLRDNLTKKHEKYDIKQIDEMLSIVSNKIKFAEIDIVPPDAEFEFKTNFGNFKKGLEIYPEWLEDSMIDLFKIEPDINYIMGEHTLNTCNLSNKLMLTLAHDILFQLKDDKLMKYFYHIINNDNHLLHITNKTDSEATNSTLYGVTYFLYTKRLNYIYVFKDDTFVFLQTFIHELMHAYYAKILGDSKHSYFLGEIEGTFGDYLVTDYLNRRGFNEEAKQLDEYSLKHILKQSYLLYFNDLMFGTQRNDDFDIDEAKREYEEELHKPWNYDINTIKKYCSIYGGDIANNIFSYLTLIDLLGCGYPNKDIFYKIKYLKMNDDSELLRHLNQLDITFMDDDYKHARALLRKLKDK